MENPEPQPMASLSTLFLRLCGWLASRLGRLRYRPERTYMRGRAGKA